MPKALDFSSLRDADLLRVFRAHIIRSRFIYMPDISAAVAASPASRFWVSDERATAVIAAMLAGNPDWDLYKNRGSRMSPLKKQMFQEILSRVIPLRNKFPDRPLSEIVSEVVAQPAPRFYLTPRTVSEYICRAKAKAKHRAP